MKTLKLVEFNNGGREKNEGALVTMKPLAQLWNSL